MSDKAGPAEMEKTPKREASSPPTPASSRLKTNTPDNPAYVYQPLDTDTSIRLIALYPGADLDDDLHCEIIHVDRKQLLRGQPNPPYYEPVSYTWGQNVDFTCILFCGHSRQLMRITPNVDEILRYLRRIAQIRYLWIDAISINQSDLNEKATQVRLMSDIFAQGSITHVYLRSDASLSHAFESIEQFGKLDKSESRYSQSKEFLDFFAATVASPSDTAALNQLLQHTWFTRRWVFQEVANSLQVSIRSKDATLSWSTFSTVLNKLAFVKKWGSTCNLELDTAVTVVEGTGPGPWGSPSILALLEKFQAANCSHPCDRVYSLYGLVHGVDLRVLPAINYQLSAPQLLTQLASNCLGKRSHEIDRTTIQWELECIVRALFAFGTLRDDNDSLPSWVPAWTRSAMPGFHASDRNDQSDMHHLLLRHPSSVWNVAVFAIVGEVFEPMAPIGTMAEFDRRLRWADALLDGEYGTTVAQSMFNVLMGFHDGTLSKQAQRQLDRLSHSDLSMAEAMATWNEQMQNSRLCVCRLRRYSESGSEHDSEPVALVPKGAKTGDHLAVRADTPPYSYYLRPHFLPKVTADLGQMFILRPHVPVGAIPEPCADFRDPLHREALCEHESIPSYRLMGRAYMRNYNLSVDFHEPPRNVMIV